MIVLRRILYRLAPTLSIVCLLAMSGLGHPGSGLLVDATGQIYFIDTGSGLWKMDTRGALTHLSPLRNHWIAIDPNNRFTQASLPTDPGHDWELTAVGTTPTMVISTDFPLVMGADGDLYFPSAREKNVRILRASPRGRLSPVLTLPQSVAGQALGWINGLTTGPERSLYYTEDSAVRRISSAGKVTTVATVPALARGPSIPGNDEHPYLRGLKVAPNGTVYVADSGDARLLKITPDGKITTIVQLESPWAPTDVAVYGETVYVLEYLHTATDNRTEWMPRIRKVGSDGKSTIILTVDQMPGARPTRTSARGENKEVSVSLLDVLLRSFPYRLVFGV